MKKLINDNRLKAQGALLLGLILFCLSACRKFVEGRLPTSKITANSAYATNSSAAAVISGIYSNMSNTGFAEGDLSIAVSEGLSADELINYQSRGDHIQFYQNALSSSTNGSLNIYFWAQLYQYIYVTNAAIAGVSTSTGVTSSMKKQLDGEAKFSRAFFYFYLVNLYGDVPLALTTDYHTNNTLKRMDKETIYQQIIKDLKDAQMELVSNYVDQNGNTTADRTRPNKGAAQALLARVYLYHKDWSLAKAEADSVLNNSGTYGLQTDLSQVFINTDQKEGIWELLNYKNSGYNTLDAQAFILTGAPGQQQFVSMTSELINSFEPNDKRFSNWVGQINVGGITYYYPYKYKSYQYGDPQTEYLVVFRVAEQFLIRAEAQAQMGGTNLTAAINDLNAIRNRAGLLNYSGPTDQSSVLAAILKERRVELFSEWGHRWFDLIRTGNINSVMGSPGNYCLKKGGSWRVTDILAPLPLSELQANPNLVQNPGY